MFCTSTQVTVQNIVQCIHIAASQHPLKYLFFHFFKRSAESCAKLLPVIIAFISLKGGVGKSTLAVHAYGYAQREGGLEGGGIPHFRGCKPQPPPPLLRVFLLLLFWHT